ncbi:MltA domain-containing protein [uncultured Cohaesibacter sp.]|uniref:murein transglycosylase A n=1 Tax=uncultured Cohaesibacter sp. TaxID=1002546 RepID=UPI0029315006|nr:MltA domain-containing protein [uncultured Cohaesibacter sp.]
MAGLKKTDFDDLAGWYAHDHKTAFAVFCDSAAPLLQKPPTSRVGSARADALLRIAKEALTQPKILDQHAARLFFETHFEPFFIDKPGLLTGYYEPVVEGRVKRDEIFYVPLHKRPDDLVALSSEDAKAAGFTEETSFARKTDQGFEFHYDRAEVMDGALDGKDLELIWLKDPLDAFVIHIQGSAQIDLGNRKTLRIAFDGKSGHPYQSLGKYLINKGIFTKNAITMDKLIQYLRDTGKEGVDLLRQNPSYIFFKAVSESNETTPGYGPKAAAGVPLAPMRSLAVDRHRHTFGLPFWLETTLPDRQGTDQPFQQLVFAHDTGSAIKGAARGDLFVGTGPDAGILAGKLQQKTRFTCLMPRQDTGSVGWERH